MEKILSSQASNWREGRRLRAFELMEQGLKQKDILYALGGRDNLLGGEGKGWVLGGNERRASGGDKTLAGGPGNDGHWAA